MARTAQTLLDEAIDLCGGQAKLAARIGVEASRVSAWKNGLEPMTAESIGLLCDVAELSAEEARRLAVLQLIERAKPARKEALRRAFFVSLAAGVAVFCGDAATNKSYAKTIVNQTLIDALYIVQRNLRRWFSMRCAVRAWVYSRVQFGFSTAGAWSLQPQYNSRFPV